VDPGANDLSPDHAERERERTPPARRLTGPDYAVAASERADPLTALAGNIGNRAMSQFVARVRDGEGIMAGGLVHPDVEAAIAASRGRGRPLDNHVSNQISTSVGDPVGDVRVHTGDLPAALARAVSARAFTVGSDIFFGAGEYRPGTGAGDELITHEVAHVIQQRGAPNTGPLLVSQPGDALEREAEALARDASG
jgi:hypothetical protein